MDRNYGRGAARRIFWLGILDRNYEGFVRFFCGDRELSLLSSVITQRREVSVS